MLSPPHAVELITSIATGGVGMTWSDLARGPGLGSAQAAQQRFERLRGRTETASQIGRV